MPFRDANFEYVRSKKSGKDKDKDSRSVAGSIISVRRHRDSSSFKTVPASETTSQISTDHQANTNLDQLPQLPESTDTSPTLRTSSHVTLGSRSSPSQIQTPATLQRYLEADACESESAVYDSQSTTDIESSREWIGPVPESGASQDASGDMYVDISTPKASKQMASGLSRKQSTSASSIAAESSRKAMRLPRRSIRTPSPSTDPFQRNVYPPSEMDNPFLAAPLPTDPPSKSPSSVLKTPSQYQPRSKTPPPLSEPSHDTSSPHMVPVAPSDSEQHSESTKSITTYIGTQAHTGPPHLDNSGHIDGHLMLLHRFTGAMPEFYLLMQQVQESYSSLYSSLRLRERQVQDLETQKFEDSRRLDDFSERLESQLRRNRAEVSELTARIQGLEELQKDLQRKLVKESNFKNDIRVANDALRAEKKDAERCHVEETDYLTRSHTRELERLAEEHAASRQSLIEMADANFSARMAELNKLHDEEKGSWEKRRLREKREFDDEQAKKHQNLEHIIDEKTKIIDEERQEHHRKRQELEDERDDLIFKMDNDHHHYIHSLEEKEESLARKHQRDLEEVTRSLESRHSAAQMKSQGVIRELECSLDSGSRQMSEANDKIVRLQKEAESHVKQAAEGRELIAHLRKELSELHLSQEAPRYQAKTESPSTPEKIRKDVDADLGSRDSSRHRLDPQETSKMRKELLIEGERSDESGEKGNKSRREVESVRAHNNGEKRASRRTSLDGRSMYKTTSNESTSSQKGSEHHPASKGKNVTWQQ